MKKKRKMEAIIFDCNSVYIGEIYAEEGLPEIIKVMFQGKSTVYVKENQKECLGKILQKCGFVADYCSDCDDENCPFNLKPAKEK